MTESSTSTGSAYAIPPWTTRCPTGDRLRAAEMAAEPFRDDGDGPAMVRRLGGGEVSLLFLPIARTRAEKVGAHADSSSSPRAVSFELVLVCDAIDGELELEDPH